MCQVNRKIPGQADQWGASATAAGMGTEIEAEETENRKKRMGLGDRGDT